MKREHKKFIELDQIDELVVGIRVEIESVYAGKSRVFEGKIVDIDSESLYVSDNYSGNVSPRYISAFERWLMRKTKQVIIEGVPKSNIETIIFPEKDLAYRKELAYDL